MPVVHQSVLHSTDSLAIANWINVASAGRGHVARFVWYTSRTRSCIFKVSSSSSYMDARTPPWMKEQLNLVAPLSLTQYFDVSCSVHTLLLLLKCKLLSIKNWQAVLLVPLAFTMLANRAWLNLLFPGFKNYFSGSGIGYKLCNLNHHVVVSWKTDDSLFTMLLVYC